MFQFYFFHYYFR